MKTTVLAFDVYGTLIDTAGVVAELRGIVGGEAEAFSRRWRDKQLEYSFRRGLMERYASFAVCTRDALVYTCAEFGLMPTRTQNERLLDAYRTLPAFDDVAESLVRLQADGFALYAFSNGTADAVDAALRHAGIRDRFEAVVSVDDVATFKPSPVVYRHFMEQTGATPEQAWLVSANPFDVIGAISAGMLAAWVRRSPSAVFDPWGIEPTVTVTGLHELGRQLGTFAQRR